MSCLPSPAPAGNHADAGTPARQAAPIDAARRRLLAAWAPALLPSTLLSACAAGVSSAPAEPAPAGLPVAAVRPVSDTYFDTVVTDPYRYFEDIHDPEVAAWMKAHSDAAHAALQALPDRAAFRARLQTLDGDAGAQATRVQPLGDGRLMYLLRRPEDNQPKLVMREASGAISTVFDPASIAPTAAINQYVASPRGRYVAVGVSEGGSEDAQLHVIEVATARRMLPPIPRAMFAVPHWRGDDAFTLNQLQANPPTPQDRDRDSGNILVELTAAGGPTVTDLPVRQWPDLQLSPDMYMGLIPLSGDRVLAVVGDGVRNEQALYLGRWSQLRSPAARWTRLAGFDDQIVDHAVAGHRLYLLSQKGAPRGQVLEADLRRPAARPRVLLKASAQVMSGLQATRHHLYVEVRTGNAQRLMAKAHGRGALGPVQGLPAGRLYIDNGWATDYGAQTHLAVGVQGWLVGLRTWSVGGAGARPQVRDLALAPSPDDSATLTATEVQVPSTDGASVPMTLLHRRDLQPDGRRPVWLNAYASYGFTMDPWYEAARTAWLERGGVLAYANPRGSGVYGKAWYEAGKGIHKHHTWEDVIACGEWLVSQGWTSPAHLGFSGRSAGGLLAGRVLTARPDLFAAVVPQVGVHDALRMETTPNGPSNIPEFGTVTTREGLQGLMAMSPYEHVQPGTAYPAVLLTHGVNDPRVEVWMSAKMAARLKAANASTQPVWLRLNYASGHGIGDSRDQRLDELADTFAFFWRHLATGEPTAG